MCGARSASTTAEGIALGSHSRQHNHDTNSYRTQFKTKDTRGAQASPNKDAASPTQRNTHKDKVHTENESIVLLGIT